MAEIINLRRARKDRQRQEKSATADANRLLFGRTKAERLQQKAEKLLSDQKLDGHKLDDDSRES